MAKSRNKTLDIYKGVLIILVFLRHVLQYSVSDEGGVLTNFIWAVQMPGFMLVAGYFAARKIGSAYDAGRRILISLQYYALPFVSWFLLIKILLLGTENRNIIYGLLKLFTRIDSGLWFLWVVFILSIIAVLANCALSSNRGRIIKAGGTLIACLGMLLIIARFAGINSFGIKYILYYAIFYGFGWLVKWGEPLWKQWWLKTGNTITFFCLIVFLAIVFNFDLYQTDDRIVSIAMRAIAGFTGNAVLLVTCGRYTELLSKIKVDKIGMYTLEIYATHMCVNNLVEMEKGLFTLYGFWNFVASLIITSVFTVVIIMTFKAIPLADLVFYGKKQKK